MKKKIYNHIAPGLSTLEMRMAQHIPAGGNWQNIPENIPSKRLEQIRKSGGRTTYYGRLVWDKPSFTITTYFNRLGNSSNLHPQQNRMISIREGARLQSFSDNFIFHGTKTSQYKQIGNAVPPLLARVIAELIEPHLESKNYIDLFAGAGGMSEGFSYNSYNLCGAVELEKHFFETFKQNHKNCNNEFLLQGDITKTEIKEKIKSVSNSQKIGVVIGGPPCQGFSYAGWRDPKDNRNQLFKEFVDIVNDIRPEFFVMENVPGILTMRKGEAVKEIIQYFSEIGYHVNIPIKLNAEDFGVPQKRRRVVIIGSLKKIKITIPRPLFSMSKGTLPKPISVYQAIVSMPQLESGAGELEMNCSYKPISAYDKLMQKEIDFDDFYEIIKIENSHSINHQIKYPHHFPIIE